MSHFTVTYERDRTSATVRPPERLRTQRAHTPPSAK